MKKRKILFIGPLPPPAGGVAIHITRLSLLLENDFEIDFIDEARSKKDGFYNIRSFRLFQYFKKVKKSDLLYVHSGSQLLRIFHLTAGWMFSKKIILTVHAYPQKKGKIRRWADTFFFQIATKIIVVNANILERVSLKKNKCVVKNAFLPPTMEAEPPLPLRVAEWISNRKKRGNLIVSANAYELKIFNNQDLYGLDMLIEVAKRMIHKGVPVSFVFNVANLTKFSDLYRIYESLIISSGLQEDFLLINEQLSFVKLIEQTDIVVRPTNTDGDALTIREALFLGKPVLASNIVDRPSGSILFKTRDITDLENKLSEVIQSGVQSGTTGEINCKNGYRVFYRDLINETLKQG